MSDIHDTPRPADQETIVRGDLARCRPTTRRPTRGLAVASLCLALLGGMQQAAAYDLPSVNLGLTSFYDGTVPYGPGFYFQHFTQVYSASKFTDNDGHRLALPSQDVNAVADLEFFGYRMPDKVGPGSFGAVLLMPTVTHIVLDDGIGHRALSGQGGLGDPVVSLTYQFDPITVPTGQKFVARVELGAILPAGEYNRSLAINPGSNAFALNPLLATTYFVTPDFSLSSRLYYLYNFANDDPKLSFGPKVRSTQAGQAFHGNFTAEYKLFKNFSVGLNSYYLQQFTDTKIDGVAAPGRRERVAGFGPGFAWLLPRDTAVVFNGYYETLARNRPEGQRYTLRFLAHF